MPLLTQPTMTWLYCLNYVGDNLTFLIPNSPLINNQTIRIDLIWWLTHNNVAYKQLQRNNQIILLIFDPLHVKLIKQYWNTTEYIMLQTINRPKHTYDQFTNNPIKLLAQAFLPLKLLRKLWTMDARWISLNPEHVEYLSHPSYNSVNILVMKPHIETWLENHIDNIKIWNDGMNISIQFKTEELAAIFKLSCL